MAQGKAITDTQIELIKATFAETGSITAAAKAASCSLSTAKKYVESRDDFEELRNEKRVDIIAKIAEVQVKLLESMVDSAHLAKASLQEKATAFGIVTDKAQLLSGEATERHEHRNTTEARDNLARRVDELAERRRTRERAGDAVGARSA